MLPIKITSITGKTKRIWFPLPKEMPLSDFKLDLLGKWFIVYLNNWTSLSFIVNKWENESWKYWLSIDIRDKNKNQLQNKVIFSNYFKELKKEIIKYINQYWKWISKKTETIFINTNLKKQKLESEIKNKRKQFENFLINLVLKNENIKSFEPFEIKIEDVKNMKNNDIIFIEESDYWRGYIIKYKDTFYVLHIPMYGWDIYYSWFNIKPKNNEDYNKIIQELHYT